MNKKLLGFSLVPSALVSSASGVVSAEDYEKEPFFSMPKSLGIPEDVIKGINEAVSINNGICNMIEKNRNLYVKKDEDFMKELKKEQNKLAKARYYSYTRLLEDENSKELIKFLPWYKLNEDDFGYLFNFEVKNFLNNYDDYENDLVANIELINKIKELINDYMFYLQRVKSLRKNLEPEDYKRNFSSLDISGYKGNGYDPDKKELAMCFQVLRMLRSKIEEIQAGYQDVSNSCIGNCNIF